MPYIVLVIDELADLMMREGKHVEEAIVRSPRRPGATGIHMVLADAAPVGQRRHRDSSRRTSRHDRRSPWRPRSIPERSSTRPALRT
jgi:hypothetical protein